MLGARLAVVLSVVVLCLAEGCGDAGLTEESLLGLSLSCFNTHYDPTRHDGHKLSRLIDQRVSEYRKILQHIKMHKKEPVLTAPVVKWAQTRDKIFVNFKLSHRQDSPPCSDIRFGRFNISNIDTIVGNFDVSSTRTPESNNSQVQFEGLCYFSDQKLLFELSMTLHSELTSLTIEREGFGSYTLVGTKAEPQIWIDPFDSVQRAAIWQDMRERYAAEMDEYFKMREERKEAQTKTRKPKRKRPTGLNSNSQQEKQANNQQL